MKKEILTILGSLLFFGCAHTGGIYTANNLTIQIPPKFSRQENDEKLVFTGPNDTRIHIISMPNGAPNDGGDMIIKSQEPITVAGQQTMLIETQEFFGTTQDVLVIHLKQGDDRYIVYAEKMTPEKFKSLLKTISISEK